MSSFPSLYSSANYDAPQQVIAKVLATTLSKVLESSPNARFDTKIGACQVTSAENAKSLTFVIGVSGAGSEGGHLTASAEAVGFIGGPYGAPSPSSTLVQTFPLESSPKHPVAGYAISSDIVPTVAIDDPSVPSFGGHFSLFGGVSFDPRTGSRIATSNGYLWQFGVWPEGAIPEHVEIASSSVTEKMLTIDVNKTSSSDKFTVGWIKRAPTAGSPAPPSRILASIADFRDGSVMVIGGLRGVGLTSKKIADAAVLHGNADMKRYNECYALAKLSLSGQADQRYTTAGLQAMLSQMTKRIAGVIRQLGANMSQGTNSTFFDTMKRTKSAAISSQSKSTIAPIEFEELCDLLDRAVSDIDPSVSALKESAGVSSVLPAELLARNLATALEQASDALLAVVKVKVGDVNGFYAKMKDAADAALYLDDHFSSRVTPLDETGFLSGGAWMFSPKNLWRQIPTPREISKRFSATIKMIDGGKRALLFGGYGFHASRPIRDVWEFTQLTERWRNVWSEADSIARFGTALTMPVTDLSHAASVVAPDSSGIVFFSGGFITCADNSLLVDPNIFPEKYSSAFPLEDMCSTLPENFRTESYVVSNKLWAFVPPDTPRRASLSLVGGLSQKGEWVEVPFVSTTEGLTRNAAGTATNAFHTLFASAVDPKTRNFSITAVGGTRLPDDWRRRRGAPGSAEPPTEGDPLFTEIEIVQKGQSPEIKSAGHIINAALPDHLLPPQPLKPPTDMAGIATKVVFALAAIVWIVVIVLTILAILKLTKIGG